MKVSATFMQMYSAKNDSFSYLFCSYSKKSIYLGNQRQKKESRIFLNTIYRVCQIGDACIETLLIFIEIQSRVNGECF